MATKQSSEKFTPNIDHLNTGLLSTDIRQEINKLIKEIKAEQDTVKRKNLENKRFRLERLENLKDGKTYKESEKQEAINKILADKKFDDVKNSDLLTLKKRGIDIANLVLVDASNPENEVHSPDMKVGDSFIVNFGENKSLRNRTGAGDILPPNVRTIEINGVKCERGTSPRPGYYDMSKQPPKYQPIYDGYSIKVLSRGDVASGDKEAIEKQWKKERVRDMIDYNDKNPFTNLDEDVGLFSEVTQEMEKRRKLKTIHSFGIETIGTFDTDARNIAQKIEKEFGIPWEVTYGQAALETGFGKHAPNNNYFGIKGPGGTFQTKEFINGEWTFINDSFRGYESMEESFIGYAQFLNENPRYKNAFLHRDNPRDFLESVKNAGYATDPDYITKIESIWKKANIDIA